MIPSSCESTDARGIRSRLGHASPCLRRIPTRPHCCRRSPTDAITITAACSNPPDPRRTLMGPPDAEAARLAGLTEQAGGGLSVGERCRLTAACFLAAITTFIEFRQQLCEIEAVRSALVASVPCRSLTREPACQVVATHCDGRSAADRRWSSWPATLDERRCDDRIGGAIV